jgi:hypothetical protein
MWCGESNDCQSDNQNHNGGQHVALPLNTVEEDAVGKFAKLAQQSHEPAIANLGVRLEAQMRRASKETSGDDDRAAVQGIYASVDELCGAYCALDGSMRGAASYFFESIGSMVPDLNAPAE